MGTEGGTFTPLYTCARSEGLLGLVFFVFRQVGRLTSEELCPGFLTVKLATRWVYHGAERAEYGCGTIDIFCGNASGILIEME